MKISAIIIIFVATISLILAAPAPPTWPTQYFVNGTFAIPYGKIVQPTTLYYDGVNNRQRFEYYNSMDVYIWDFNTGWLHEIVPKINNLTCFNYAAPASPGDLVTLLPDVSTWVYQGTATINGINCYNWQQTLTNFTKTAVFNFYIEVGTNMPVQLYLNGYDFIFDSHPDIYIMTYDTYIPNYYNASVFNSPTLCSTVNSDIKSQRGAFRAKALLGQLNALTPPTVINDEFDGWMFTHSKYYGTTYETEMRRKIYYENLKYIEQHNKRSDVTFTLAMNHLGDLTDDEAKELYMPRGSEGSVNTATRYHEVVPIDTLPATVNWTAAGAVNPPKDQGVCGSCWTFGTIGSLEGAWEIKTGILLSLAEQQIVDCAWLNWGGPGGNLGCDGGYAAPAFQWIINNGGVALESSYPYLMQDHWCNSSDKTSGVVVQGYVNVTEGSESALQSAVALGPVAVAIDASQPSFRFYSSGVYYEPLCKNDVADLDHEVLAVGYGTYNGSDYWLVKNSWSTHWGNVGYVMMSRNRGNNCGIATQATYPLV